MFVNSYYFQKSNFVKFLKIWSFINLPWGHVMSPQNLGPIGSAVLKFFLDTNEQTDKQAKFKRWTENVHILDQSK